MTEQEYELEINKWRTKALALEHKNEVLRGQIVSFIDRTMVLLRNHGVTMEEALRWYNITK